jgi:hypothetical protein
MVRRGGHNCYIFKKSKRVRATMAQSLGGVGSPTQEQTVLVEKIYSVIQQGLYADATCESVWNDVVAPLILGKCPTRELFELLRDALHAKLLDHYMRGLQTWIQAAIRSKKIKRNQQWKSVPGTDDHRNFILVRDAKIKVQKKAARVLKRVTNVYKKSGATNSGGTSGNSSSSSSSTGSNKILDGGTQVPRDALAAAPVPVAGGRCSGAPAESQPCASRALAELQPSSSRASAEHQRQPSVPAKLQPKGVAADEDYAVILPQICKKNIKYQ